MQSKSARALVALGAVVVVVVAFVALNGEDEAGRGSDGPPQATSERAAPDEAGGQAREGGPPPGAESEPSGERIAAIVIEDGRPVGGVAELELSAGEQARFVVASDTAAEVHVHGYDLTEDVEAGGKVRFDFPADIEGIFEVELEATATPIAELTVTP